MKNNRYSADEIQEINSHYGLSELSEKLGRSELAIVHKKYLLKLQNDVSDINKNKPYSEEEIQFIIENKDKSSLFIAQKLNRGLTSINYIRVKLGLSTARYNFTDEQKEKMKNCKNTGDVMKLSKEWNIDYQKITSFRGRYGFKLKNETPESFYTDEQKELIMTCKYTDLNKIATELNKSFKTIEHCRYRWRKKYGRK